MTLEEFVKGLGLADDKQAESVASLKKLLDGEFVTKARFNELNEEKKTLITQLADRDKQLETLKNSKGDADAFKAEIKKLQESNATEKAEHEAKVKELQFNNAIKLAITDKAQDVDIVSGLFNKTKLILGEDGKVTGLDEQIKTLQESKPFLFKPDAKAPNYNPNGGKGGTAANPFAKENVNLTEQARLFKENPEQARALAQAAGVNI